MEDVKDPVSSAPEGAAVEKPTEQGSQPVEQTSETTQQVEPERTIPYGRFSQVNDKLRKTQRELAELRAQSQYGQYDPNDLETVMAHPAFQEMALRVAKQELTDFTREAMDNYPTLHPAVKKAILKNVRGFVNEATNDIEQAKLDVVEYIESIVEEAQQEQPQQKQFPVAQTNVPQVTPSAKPAQVMKILAKPVDEWTEEEQAVVDDYRKTNPKK